MIDPARDSKARILGAAINVIRAKGYSATRVDDLCAAAGLTKGGFFHHFKCKEDLAVAAAQAWTDHADALFAAAPYQTLSDPLERLLGYIDLRRDLLTGGAAEFSCLAGTMAQEAFDTHPAIREAARACIFGHAAGLEADIEAAMALYGAPGDWTARSLALHTQAVLQGAFILAKASGEPRDARDSVEHLRRYFELLFRKDPRR